MILHHTNERWAMRSILIVHRINRNDAAVTIPRFRHKHCR